MRLGELVETAARSLASLVLMPPAVVVLSFYAMWLARRGASIEEIQQKTYLRMARFGSALTGNPVEAFGTERLDPGQSYVIVSNHESNMDPFAIIVGLHPLIPRYIVKTQIMRIPIFGHALAATGNVLVRRHETAGDVQRIREGMQARHPKVSILFFAEGTRSRSGALQPFKKGAFATAIQERLPVLPVALSTRRTWPPNRLYVRPGAWLLEVGEPIPVDGLALKDRDALRDQTREAVVKLRARVRQRMRDRGLDPGGVD